MRKLIVTAAAALALVGVAACSNPAEKAADSQADAIQATGEANAEKLEADAKAPRPRPTPPPTLLSLRARPTPTP